VAQAPEHPGIGPDIAGLLARGAAVVVATRDERLRPEVTRGWGVAVAESGDGVRLCVEAALGSPTRENLVAGAPIAVSCSLPSTYRSAQMKGIVVAVEEPAAEDLERADAHHAAFAADALNVGIPSRLAPRFYDRPSLVAVSVTVADLFDQTPGPTAGARL
jgi:hypothetical protein